MTWLSVTLIALGVADLLRARDLPAPRWAGPAGATVTVVLVALGAGLTALADIIALALALVVMAVWMMLSGHTQATGRGALRALAVFGFLVAALIACSGWASTPDGPLAAWLRWADLPGADRVAPGRVILLVGLVLFNIATANVIVRLVLLAIGALRPDQVTAPQAPQPADRLKGGRLLGPMERLLIIGLGLAGEFGAASIVIAAKGLLRFPEIQAAGRSQQAGRGSPIRTGPVGIDDVTEYFLVGSFVSWLIALVSLALAST